MIIVIVVWYLLIPISLVATSSAQEYEQIISEALQKPISQEKRFLILVLSARTFYQNHLYDLSKKYYELALKIKLKNQNYTEVYLNLLKIYFLDKDRLNAQRIFKEAKPYFDSHHSHINEEARLILSYYHVLLSDRTSNEILNKKTLTVLTRGFLSNTILWHDVEILMRRGQYENAFKMLHREGLLNGNISEKIIYDLLNVLVHQKNVKDLLCAPLFSQFQKRDNYALILCGLLTNYLGHQKLNQSQVARFTQYIMSKDQDKLYLLEAVRKLK